MSAEIRKEIELEIAHVLFIDIVGYSKLSINEQRAAVDELTEVVRSSDQYQKSDAAARLIKISTGDGMGLVFYTSPEAPARCAIEISLLLKEHPRLQLRMGVHSGPVSGLIDVNDFLLGLAQIESHTGRSEAAVKILPRLLTIPAGGYVSIARLKIDPIWDPIRNDPGFQKLLSEPEPETIYK